MNTARLPRSASLSSANMSTDLTKHTQSEGEPTVQRLPASTMFKRRKKTVLPPSTPSTIHSDDQDPPTTGTVHDSGLKTFSSHSTPSISFSTHTPDKDTSSPRLPASTLFARRNKNSSLRFSGDRSIEKMSPGGMIQNATMKRTPIAISSLKVANATIRNDR